MTLALLVGRCEEEFICDMAETYHVLNWRELPLKTAAILASGLPPESRSRMKLSGQKLTAKDSALLAILDDVRTLAWAFLQVHSDKKIPAPKSVLQQALHQDQQPKALSFRTPEEFEEQKRRIIEGGQNAF